MEDYVVYFENSHYLSWCWNSFFLIICHMQPQTLYDKITFGRREAHPSPFQEVLWAEQDRYRTLCILCILHMYILKIGLDVTV